MHIPAFTNAVGAFNQNAWQEWRSINNLNGTVANSGADEYRKAHSTKSPTIKSNGISPTDYTRVVREVEELQGHSWREVGHWYNFGYIHTDRTSEWSFIRSYYNPLSYYPNVDSEVDEVRNESNVKARTRWLEGRLQLGADIGELKSTQNMIASNAIVLAKALQAARRKQWNLIPGILGMSWRDVLTGRYPANKFLEYIYGWRPLVQSLFDGYEFMKKESAEQSVVLKSTGRSRRSFTREWTGNGGVAKHSVVGLVRSQTEYLAKVERPRAFTLAGAGLINPATIAWELVPFSFVVDWFIPVGTILDAYSFNPALEFVEGFRSWSIEWTHTLRYEVQASSWYDSVRQEGWATIPLRNGFLKERSREFYRQRLVGFEPPGLYTKQNPFSNQHVLNAAALIRSLM